MLRTINRVLVVLFLLGVGGHTLGSLQAYHDEPQTLVWSLSASVLGALLGALSLLRGERANDRALGWITIAGNVCWCGLAIAFGTVIGNVLDPRVVANLLLALGLVALSWSDLSRYRHGAAVLKGGPGRQ